MMKIKVIQVVKLKTGDMVSIIGIDKDSYKVKVVVKKESIRK